MKKKWFIIGVIIFFMAAEVVSSIVNKHDDTRKEVVFMNNFYLMSDKLEEYEKEFEKIHPEIDIRNECIGDNYETICSYRLNAGNAGDVMVVPSSMNISYYEDYYEPLGTVEELSDKYRFTEIKAVNNNVYSIPTDISISGGIMYNMDVLKQAGILNVPETYEEFLSAMKAIKSNTDSVPLYSNTKDSEQLKEWNSLVYTFSGDADYNEKIALNNNILEENNSYYKVYSLFYNCVDEDLVEDNYLTSKWEEGSSLFESGKVGAAVVNFGSYLNIKEQYDNPDSIVYMPLSDNKRDKNYLYAEAINGLAINSESKNKEEAKMWLEFLLNDTDFLEEAGDSGILSKNDNLDSITKINSEGMDIIYSKDRNKGVLGLFEKRDNNSGLGMINGTFASNLINQASSGKETFDEFCDECNEEWKKSGEE